ncbi:ribonuclease HII [Anaerophilus nitritogenes]|uniref:ribonuclease HII n=1 Tax=Anaerophilus nitritogenes TaxID=2498136 RepID=UPI00101D1BD3|nr:ribonuclease HII [Anaerophilus nitritogenes]
MEFSNMSVKEINDFINSLPIEEAIKEMNQLKEDKRSSVQKIAQKINKQYKNYLDEKERVKKLWNYEKKIGCHLIAGIDEAGRGPLAGPVVAAAVILPHDLFIEGINDSKKISAKKREQIFDVITKEAISIGVGIVDEKMIDKINIFEATKLAMKIAVEKLNPSPEYLLIDAVKLTDIHINQMSIEKGDAKSISIAAASIIAKVTRDRIMDDFHKQYPQYGFIHHKGYGTKEHYENIQKYGILSIHRKSFLKNIMGD